MPLHPEHLEDLKKSGLSDEMISGAGIYTVVPGDINKKLGFNDPEISSLLAFPYPGNNGFERYKPFPVKETKKYLQPKNSPNHLYILNQIRSKLADTSIALYFTEGEKKTLKAVQEGLPCVAMSGLWNWSDGREGKNLICDFDLIKLEGREVYLVPDNDWEQPDRHGKRKNLRQAVYELTYRLIDRGAKPWVVELPVMPVKMGLDDYLCHHTVEDFHSLPKRPIRKQTIEEMIEGASLDTLQEILKGMAGLPELESAVHVSALAKKLNITRRAIQKDIETLKAQKINSPDIEKLLESGANLQSIWSAQNFVDGVLSFGAILGGQRILVRSDGEIILANGSNGDSFRFKRSALAAEAIKNFRAGEDVDGRNLLNRIMALFIDHIFFRDDRTSMLLSVWIMGTYLFKLFRFYGYLWINSPVKRCAKSLVLDILSRVCFNSTSRLVNPSSSFLFREVDCNDGTVILDEIESLSGAEKEQRLELISLLNGGFQKGSQVPRIESKNREFVVTYFNAYSPKALAGTKSIIDTLEDRSFKIPMFRKKKNEIVKRFNLRALDSHIEKIREDCFLWALRHALDVSEVYEEMTELQGTENLDDRMKDILEPLLSIASVIDAQAGETQTINTLIELAREIGKGREDSESLTGLIPAVVELMKDLVDGIDERFVSADDLFAKFRGDEDLSFIQSKRGLAFFLAKLDLHRIPPKKIEGKTVRGYSIRRNWVDELAARYA